MPLSLTPYFATNIFRQPSGWSRPPSNAARLASRAAISAARRSRRGNTSRLHSNAARQASTAAARTLSPSPPRLPNCKFCATCQGCSVCPYSPEDGQRHDHGKSLCPMCKLCIGCPRGGNRFAHRNHYRAMDRHDYQSNNPLQPVAATASLGESGKIPKRTKAAEGPSTPAVHPASTSDAQRSSSVPVRGPASATRYVAVGLCQPTRTSSAGPRTPSEIRSTRSGSATPHGAAFDVSDASLSDDTAKPTFERHGRFEPVHTLTCDSCGLRCYAANLKEPCVSNPRRAGRRGSPHVHFAV